MSKVIPRLILALLLLVALGIRIPFLWKLFPYYIHTDETFLVNYAANMLAQGDPNPGFYHYGSLLMYIYAFFDLITYWFLQHLSFLNIEPLHSLSEIIAPPGRQFISHPSLLVVNRMVSLLFGILALFFGYRLTRVFTGRSFALYAVGFLSICTMHTYHSAIATPNMAMTCFTLMGAWFSVNFYKNHQQRDFLSSVICIGLALSIKLHTVLFLSYPLFALWSNRHMFSSKERRNMFLQLALIPPGIFALTNPYAILNFKIFINNFSLLFHFYLTPKVVITPADKSGHLVNVIKYFNLNMGTVNFIIALAGMVWALYKNSQYRLIMIPCLGMLAILSLFKQYFSRNLIFLDFFLVIAMAFALFNFTRILEKHTFLKKYSTLVILLVCLIFNLPRIQTINSYITASKEVKDTRTSTIDAINSSPAKYNFVIARELLFSPLDLKRIDHKWKQNSIEEILSSRMKKNTIYLLPARFYYSGHSPSQKEQELYGKLLKRIKSKHTKTNLNMTGYPFLDSIFSGIFQSPSIIGISLN